MDPPRMPPMRTLPGQPRYKALSDELRKRILAGRRGYQPGDKFPTEPQLIEMSGYSRETVRQAVKVLRAEGLLEIILGVGTYVTERDEWKVRR